MLKFLIPALLFSTTPQLVSAHEVEGSIEVSYRDLDLRSPEGVAQLDRRISAAISRLCSDYERVPLAQQIAAARCVKDAKTKVNAQRRVALGKAEATGLAYAGNR